MLNATQIDTIARAYHHAEKERADADPAAHRAYPGFTIEDAYAVQRRWVEIKVGEGSRVKGDLRMPCARLPTSISGCR